jgi:hypothetical protein
MVILAKKGYITNRTMVIYWLFAQSMSALDSKPASCYTNMTWKGQQMIKGYLIIPVIVICVVTASISCSHSASSISPTTTTSIHTIDSPAMTKTIFPTLTSTITITRTTAIAIPNPLFTGGSSGGLPETTIETTTTKILNPLILKYSFSLTEQIGDKYQASPGYIYLIVHLFIENQGDLPFVTQARNFKIMIQNVKYTNLMVPLDNELKEVELLHGGKVSGDLVFEVQNIWGGKAPPLEPDFQEILLIYEQ